MYAAEKWSSRCLLTMLLLGIVGCATPDPAPPGAFQGVLLPSVQVYTAGEDVTLVLQVTNTGAEPVELTFSDGQSFDFVVRSGEREVWRWSADQMFTQALREEQLEPGESRHYEAIWRPGPGENGDFVATAVLTATNHRVEQSTPITLP